MILDEIIEKKRERVENLKSRVSIEDLKQRICLDECRNLYDVLPFEKALRQSDFAVIAEVKKASPSKGLIAKDYNPQNTARIYGQCGADAISVLTEEDFFQGSSRDLQAVKAVVSLPVLRKDFIIDPWQIYEAKALGADAILLIVAVLSDEQLLKFQAIARILGLSALVEVHDALELKRALDADASIIGINNRDLRTFEVSMRTTEALMPLVPKDKLVISESGIKTPEDIAYLKTLGVHGVLVGETLMRADSVGEVMEMLFGRKEKMA